MAAPGALDYGDPAASLHHTLGPLIVSFSVIAVWEPVRGSRFVNLPFALVLVLATPVLTLDPAPVGIALVTGLGAGGLSAATSRIKGRYAGGWRMLIRGEEATGPNAPH